jgi:hypothetical protein
MESDHKSSPCHFLTGEPKSHTSSSTPKNPSWFFGKYLFGIFTIKLGIFLFA